MTKCINRNFTNFGRLPYILFPCCCQALAIHYSEYDEGRDEKRPTAHTKESLNQETPTLEDTQYLTPSRDFYNNECMRSTIMTVADPAWYRPKLCFCNDSKVRSFHFCCPDQLIFHHMHFFIVIVAMLNVLYTFSSRSWWLGRVQTIVEQMKMKLAHCNNEKCTWKTYCSPQK